VCSLGCGFEAARGPRRTLWDLDANSLTRGCGRGGTGAWLEPRADQWLDLVSLKGIQKGLGSDRDGRGSEMAQDPLAANVVVATMQSQAAGIIHSRSGRV